MKDTIFSSVLTEEFDDPECYSISGFSAEAVRKYLQHYHLRIHYPQVELKLTVDNCNDVRKIALYCGDEEIAKQAQAYFQKNISNANLKDAIEIGMYEAVANFVPDAYQGITGSPQKITEKLEFFGQKQCFASKKITFWPIFL